MKSVLSLCSIHLAKVKSNDALGVVFREAFQTLQPRLWSSRKIAFVALLLLKESLFRQRTKPAHGVSIQDKRKFSVWLLHTSPVVILSTIW